MAEELTQEDLEELREIFAFLRELRGLDKEQAMAELALRLTDPEYVKFTSIVTLEEAEAMAEEFVIAKRYRHAQHIADYALEELILRCCQNGWRGRQYENMIVEGKKAEKVGLMKRAWQRLTGKPELAVEERRLE